MSLFKRVALVILAICFRLASVEAVVIAITNNYKSSITVHQMYRDDSYEKK